MLSTLSYRTRMAYYLARFVGFPRAWGEAAVLRRRRRTYWRNDNLAKVPDKKPSEQGH